MEDNRKGFLPKYVGSKREAKESVGPLLSEIGDLVKREKWMYLMPPLPWFSQVRLIPKPGRVCGSETTLAGGEDRVRHHLTTLTCTSLWDQLGCIQELADVIARLLFVIFERSWHLGEASQDWKKAVSHPSSRWMRKRIQGTTGWSVAFSWEGDGADHYKNSFQTHEGQERGWREQPTWV